MTQDSDVKRALFQGIYEDNLGLPRSFKGKRRVSVADSEPLPPPEQPGAGPVARRNLGRMVVAILCMAVVVGFAFRGFGSGDAASEARATGVVARPDIEAGSPPLAARSRPVATTRSAEGVAFTSAATSGQYDEMLSRLGMPVADLFDLSVHTIVIDPGHGGSDPGAIGHQGLQEKEVALDIARRLRDKLTATGSYEVVLTRDDDRRMRLNERVAFANQSEADVFISIHINSVPEEAGPVNYVETYYFGPHMDQQTLELAEKENENSNFAMTDFRQIIERIGDTFKTEESAQLAASIHDRLYTNLKRHSSDLLDAGAKSGPFVVLLGVEVPSVLVEISCISNEAEAERLGTPEYRESIASYLQLGIVEYLESRG